MVNFPASLDDSSSLPNPSSGNFTNNPTHAGLHDNENDAIKAIEAKLGTGSSVPAINTLPLGTGPGTSAWTQLTSAQLAAVLSDETGSGAAVFGTTPTLVTPKVDTINESTPGNGTTIGGVNIKSGALNTSNSVVTSNLTNASVTASKLATGAQAAIVNTLETTASTSYTDLATPGPAVTVTIGVNGLALLVIGADQFNVTSNSYTYMGWAASGANTIAATDIDAYLVRNVGGTLETNASFVKLLTGLTPGSTTFTAKYRVNANTGSWQNRKIAVIPL